MLAMEAKKIGFEVRVLDPTRASPAGQICDQQIVGGYFDRDKLRELAATTDVLTYDLEHIDTWSLHALEVEGAVIHPSPRLLTVAIDNAQNAGILAARILGVKHQTVREAVEDFMRRQTQNVLDKAASLEKT